jgi:hypothetical protein
VRIGPNLHDQYGTATDVCTPAPFCTFVQTKLEGDAMRAPFSGTITRWRVMYPNGSFWLQVLRRHRSGKYESLRSTDPTGKVTSSMNQVKRFHTHLHIHRGDYVAIAAEDFYASFLASRDGLGQGFCWRGLVPGLDDGESAQPNPSYGECTALLLYNVTLRR